MLTRLTLYLAYSIKTSERHHLSKRFCYDLLENPKSKIKPYFDIFMITLVMSSVFILIHEVKNESNLWSIYFENFVVSIFLCEYLLRGWIYSDMHHIIIEHHENTKYLGQPFSLTKVIGQILKNKLAYIFSPSAIIDLLAILPSYRPLRILRVFLIFRLFKLLRYSQSIQMFTGILKSKQFELTTLAIFMGFLVFIASTAIYIFEHQSVGGQINTLYDAFYWAIVTISTVGYGDIVPISTGGRLVTSALIISGLGVLAFFTSIIVAAFSEKMSEFQEDRVKSTIEKSKNSIILCGFGRVGQEIAQQLSENKKEFIVIDPDKQHADLAVQKGYITLNEDASKNSTLLHAGINHGAKTVLCVTGDDVINVYITLTSRHLNPDINIISRANRDDNVKKLYQAGANHIVQPFSIAGLLASEHIGQPVAFDAIQGILHQQKNGQIDALPILKKCFLAGLTIEQAQLSQYKTSLLGVISANPSHEKRRNRYKLRNQHFYFNPEPSFILHDGDILVLLGRQLSIEFLQSLIEKSHLSARKEDL